MSPVDYIQDAERKDEEVEPDVMVLKDPVVAGRSQSRKNRVGTFLAKVDPAKYSLSSQ
jgi:hypothetical protein